MNPESDYSATYLPTATEKKDLYLEILFAKKSELNHLCVSELNVSASKRQFVTLIDKCFCRANASFGSYVKMAIFGINPR